jgi:hypothetical protein
MSFAASPSRSSDASSPTQEKFLDASLRLRARDRGDGSGRAGATFTSTIVPLEGRRIETFFSG